MLNEVTMELINLAIDKQATPAQQAELAEILGKSEEARIAFEAIQEMVRQIEASAPVEAPEVLRDAVLRELRARQSPPHKKSRGWQPTFRRSALYLHPRANTYSDSVQPMEVRAMEQTKRKNFLFAFAAAAAVIAVVVVIWAPSYPPQNASGAIGAVQKHHVQQIGAQDVILGDETAKQQAKVIFADDLSDATKLQSISSNLSSQAALSNQGILSNAQTELQNQQSELASRFVFNMGAAVNSMAALLNRDGSSLNAQQVANINSQLQSISSSLNSHLDGSQMSALNNQLANAAHDLQSALGSHELSNAQLSNALANLVVWNRADLASHELSNALGSLVVWNRGDLNDKAVLSSATQLNSFASQLNDKNILGVSFADRATCLNSIVLQSNALANVQSSLNSMLMSRVENGAALQNSLASASSELASAASQLESAALNNMQEHLNAQTQIASMLQNLHAVCNSSKLNNQAALSNAALFNHAVDNVAQALQNLDAQLQSQAAANMQAELGSIGSHLDSAVQLQSKLNSSSQLNARVENQHSLNARVENQQSLNARVENQQQLGAAVLFNRTTLNSFNSYLNNLSQTLQSSALGAKVANRADLANQASALQNRSADLGARIN